MHRTTIRLLLVYLAALSPLTAQAGQATRLVVALPGQTLVPGVGLVGTPTDQVQRVPFPVRVYATDDDFAVDASYAGPIRAVLTDEPQPVLAHRFGTSISGIGAATTIADGSLRLSLNGGPFQEIPLGSPEDGDQVCQAILAGIALFPPHAWGLRPDLACEFDSFSLRFTLFLDDGTPVRAVPGATFKDTSITVDPTFGSASMLKLGVASPSTDPGMPEELSAQILQPQPSFAERFSRGIAFFEVLMAAPTPTGSMWMVQVDQGDPPALPVISTGFRVIPSTLVIEQVDLHDADADGAFDEVRMYFNHLIDPASLPEAGAFRLRLDLPGSTILAPGQSIGLQPDAGLGYAHSRLTVTFGSGLPTTGLEGVALEVLPTAASLMSAETGESFNPGSASTAVLVDRAPPVLLGTTSVDTDGNGSPDQLQLIFSESVQFSAGRGFSLGRFDPPPAETLTVPSSLRIRTGGPAGIDRVLTLTHPDDPAQTTIAGGSQIARAVSLAARRAEPDPAWAHLTAIFEPVFRRYVIRSGETGASSSVEVMPASPVDDAAAPLGLLPAEGGLRRDGTDPDQPRIEDFLVVAFFGANLLSGMTDSDIVVDGNRVIVSLNNSPAGAVGTPSFAYLEDLGGLSLADLADNSNAAVPFNNFGNPPTFHPSGFIKIRDNDSAPDDGTVTATTGVVALDASPTVVPLNALNGASLVGLRWVQVSGPVTVPIENPESFATEATILRAGTYVFELTLQVQPPTPPLFNQSVRSDGTLSRQFTFDVQPGGTSAVAIVLPGQTLNQGVPPGTGVVGGAPDSVQAGTLFRVEAYAVDAFGNINFNESSAQPVSLSASFADPASATIEAPKPLVGGQATFDVTDLREEDDVIFSATSPVLPGATSSSVDVAAGPPERYVILLPGETLREGRALHSEAVAGPARIATAGVPYEVRVMVTDRFFNVVLPPTGGSALIVTTDPADAEPSAQPLASSTTTYSIAPFTPGAWVVDDEVLVVFEQGDEARPYVVGSLWNARADHVPGSPESIRLTWDPDPRPAVWNIYSFSRGPGALADLDRDGFPDIGYGVCLTGTDPDPTDTGFTDDRVPSPNRVLFYLGTMTLNGQETSLGLTSAGRERPNLTPCP